MMLVFAFLLNVFIFNLPKCWVTFWLAPYTQAPIKYFALSFCRVSSIKWSSISMNVSPMLILFLPNQMQMKNFIFINFMCRF
jgi:hypothetical protein